MYAITFILHVRDNISCWHHAGWDQSSKFHHGKWKSDKVIWRQEHILDRRCLCKEKGDCHRFAVLTWNSDPAQVPLQHVLSKLYQNNPRITEVTSSIPTNLLTLQTTLKRSLGFKYSSSPAATYKHQTGRRWELELGGQPWEELLPVGSRCLLQICCHLLFLTQGLFKDSTTTGSQLGKSDCPSMDLEQHKLLNRIFRKNQYLLILFYSARCRVVKLTKLSWFYRKGLGLERMTSTRNIGKKVFQKCATVGTDC